MGTLGYLLGGLDQAEQYASLGSLGKEVPFVQAAKGIDHDLVHLFAVLRPLVGVGESGIQQLRFLEEIDDVLPRRPAPGLHDDPSVGAGHGVGEVLAGGAAAVLGAAHEGVHGLGGHHGGGDAVVDGNVDVLSPAAVLHTEQAYGGGRRAVEAALVLRLEPAVLQGFPALGPADAHNHPHGIADNLLTQVLAVGPFLAEGRDGGHHEGRIELLKGIVSQAQRFQMSGMEGLDHDVDSLDQLFQEGPTGGGFQVDGGALLVQVEHQIEEALFGMRVVLVEGTHTPQCRPARRLQLQNVGPVVGQQPGAERAGDVLAQVQDLHAPQHPRRHPSQSLPVNSHCRYGPL